MFLKALPEIKTEILLKYRTKEAAKKLTNHSNYIKNRNHIQDI